VEDEEIEEDASTEATVETEDISPEGQPGGNPIKLFFFLTDASNK
jgi:hypothetical protein